MSGCAEDKQIWFVEHTVADPERTRRRYQEMNDTNLQITSYTPRNKKTGREKQKRWPRAPSHGRMPEKGFYQNSAVLIVCRQNSAVLIVCRFRDTHKAKRRLLTVFSCKKNKSLRKCKTHMFLKSVPPGGNTLHEKTSPKHVHGVHILLRIPSIIQDYLTTGRYEPRELGM